MAMNIPAPVQILRYEIPEGTPLSAFGAYLKNTLTAGALLYAKGRVIYDIEPNIAESRNNIYFDVHALFIGLGYDDHDTRDPWVVIPLGTAYGNDSGIVHDIYPYVGNVFSDLRKDYMYSLQGRGFLGNVQTVNVDQVDGTGIYVPDESSTLPDIVDLQHNIIVAQYVAEFFYVQLLFYRTDSDIEIYIRTNLSAPVNNPQDWTAWQPLGGSPLTAGDGISITDGAVAVDGTVVRTEGEQAINGSLRVWHYASAAVTVSKKDTDGNVNAKLSPNNLYFRFGDNARDFVSITSGGTASSMGNSTYARLTAHNDAIMSSAILSVHATDEGMYATAPSTRSTPVNDEIITYDYFRDHTVTLRTGNIFVDNVNGSDSNDGLTADTALATFDAAIALRQKVNFYSPDSNDDVITINLAASATPYTYSKVKIPSRTIIRGAGRDTTSINFSAGLNGSAIYIVFQDLTLDFVGTPENTTGLLAFYGCTVSVVSCTIRDSTNTAMYNVIYTGDSGYIYMSDVILDLNASELESVIFNNYNSACVFNNITITGSATVSRATVAAENTSDINVTGLSVSSATITGKRYRAMLGGGINTNGAGPNAIPGSEAGTVDDTSWYK